MTIGIAKVRNEEEAYKLAKEFTEKTGWKAGVSLNFDSKGVYYFVCYDNLCIHGWHGGCPKGCHANLTSYYEEKEKEVNNDREN